MQSYLELEKTFSRYYILNDVNGLLLWDKETMMPAGSLDARTEHLSLLARLCHEQLVSKKTGELLEKAAQQTVHLSDWQRANLHEMQHTYAHAAAVPADLVAHRAKITSEAWPHWINARKNNDFKSVLPYLEKIVETERDVGAVIGKALGLKAYDALIDTYDPGGRQEKIDIVFDELRGTLPALIDEAIEKQKSKPPAQEPRGPFPIETQKNLALKLAEALGFDIQRGRLDISAHPFCGGASGDVRITTRYTENDFLSAMMGIFHEVGHAVYDQNRPSKWYYQPVGRARGMGVHESQSLIFEKQACRSLSFLSFFAREARSAFHGNDATWSTENIYALATQVKRGFIRVDADELTYPAHIIVRYDLEKVMINGDLDPKDLPGAFNDGIKKMLGLVVTDDRQGCLQDPHWYGGNFGYFPSYTLGAMMAAQLFKAACNDNAQLLPSLGTGDFKPLREWLGRNIHQKASSLSEDALLMEATGEKLNPQIFLNHLRHRYIDHAA